MNQTAALVIDDNRVRANELRLLLKFMEAGDVVLAGTDDWTTHWDDRRDWRAVFLGELRGSELDRAVRAIRQADAGLPIILVEEPNQPLNLPPDLAADCCARLTRPFLQSKLQQLLGEQVHRKQTRTEREAELFRSLVGGSRAIAQVRELIKRVSDTNATVLILGESGTGKEVVARNIHYYSSRRSKPFVPLNCGAIPRELLESELFGHEKGAFTGAITTRRGRFELAEGGTLFLDEIGDMPVSMQVKLLRVLQERSFERVGSNKSIAMDTRIISATHRNLESMVNNEEFREDLYYRLNVFPIEMPALRERIEDLPLLVSDLLQRLRGEQGIEIQLSSAALRCLSRYPWPGNVRELANLIERLGILNPGGVVDVKDLPLKFRGGDGGERLPGDSDAAESALDQQLPVRFPPGGIDLRQYLAELESRLIQAALNETGDVVAHAATLLKMRRTTLVEKIRKYGLRGVE